MKKNFNTLLARLGGKTPASASVPKNLPITLSSVFVFDDVKTLDAVYDGEADGYVYSRMCNPVHTALSEIMYHIDGGEAAEVFSSGMAAITMSILTHAKAGDHIIASNVLYGESYIFLNYELKKFNIDVTFVDILKDDLQKYFKENTKIVYIETISNPLLNVTDIEKISTIAHRHNTKVLVDNTFATPIVCQPLKLGADIVIYSATKYICGHGDVMGGIVVSDKKTAESIGKTGTLYGTVISPFDSWLLIRSLKTLELRVTQHSNNALKLAQYFEKHPKIKKVYYPGLESFPSFTLAKQIFNNNLFGGMLSIDLNTDEKGAYKFVDELEGIKFVPSLADVETTVCCPAKTSHRDLNEKELEEAGISKGLIRISVGLENIEDLIAEFDKALEKI